MRKKILWISFGACCAMITVGILAFNTENMPKTASAAIPVTDTLKAAKTVSPFKIAMPQRLDFAGEQVPLDDDEIRERLEKEILINGYGLLATNTLIYKKTTRYFPVIERILREKGVPDDFKFLCVAESGLNSTILSPVGAGGFWQFMPETARKYKLEVSAEKDERFHLEKATYAACEYLTFLHDKFGSWTLAAAAYNRGESGVEKAISDQKIPDFYNLYLNKETYAYLFRILAFKQIFTAPLDYGYVLDSNAFYKPYLTRKVQINKSIEDLPQWCLDNQLNYKTLRNLNPWLLKYRITVKEGETLELELPQ